MSKITTTINLSPGVHNAAEYEAEIEVTYSVTSGRPATGPTYACGGEPAEDASVDISAISVIANPGPGGRWPADWLINIIGEDEELLALCLQDAAEHAIDAEEYRAEARREELMERGQ